MMKRDDISHNNKKNAASNAGIFLPFQAHRMSLEWKKEEKKGEVLPP